MILTRRLTYVRCRALFAKSLWTVHRPCVVVGYPPSYLSSSTPCIRQFSVGADEDEPEVVLYQSGLQKITVMRSGFALSTLHTLYWIWYITDFVPAVNQSPIPDMHIDPMIPAFGMAIATFLQGIFTVYPLRLLSKISWQPKAQTLVLYNHALPWIRPNPSPKRIPVGHLLLDASSGDAQRLINKLGGDLRLYRGHLMVQQPKAFLPYLLNIQDDMDVREAPLLLQALLSPERLRSSNNNETPQSSRKKSSHRPRRSRR